MNDSGGGCIVGLVVLAALAWVPLHFSGKSILYSRTTSISPTPNEYGVKSAIVTCHYFTSTGTEDKAKYFSFGTGAENYYCPRYRDIGQ